MPKMIVTILYDEEATKAKYPDSDDPWVDLQDEAEFGLGAKFDDSAQITVEWKQ